MWRRRTEDYVEAIFDLSSERGYTRVKDIASSLNVKPASVSEMMAKLQRYGYIFYEKRLFVALTDEGKQLALEVKKRREVLIKFLGSIGVSSEVAEKDACIIEHVLDHSTIEQLSNLVSFIEEAPNNDPRWLRHFREYCKNGVHPCIMVKGSN
ncbi:MAG: metal-dependent transcriptional regulator [Archaeoglobaceae archaeon]